MEIAREDLAALFDIVACSMDFGSGFLDTPEVELLRRVAVVLDVDPMKATPDNHRRNYPHSYEPGPSRMLLGYGRGTACLLCREPEDFKAHRGM